MVKTFNLQNMTRGLAQLANDEDPAAKSVDGSNTANKPYQFEQSDYDRTEAPKDEMRTYWRQFESTPLLRKPITSFASQVVEPGYYIESDSLSDSQKDKLENWLSTCAILETEKDNDFRQFAKKAIVQREVRGTVLTEKVPLKDDEGLYGFKMINPETTEVVTRPNQALLLEPDDIKEFPDAPTTDNGEAAAYIQDLSETGETRWGTPIKGDDDGDGKIEFTQEEIIKITRDADIGEAYGTSRIESVSDRISGLKQKLDDNDEAIASKAYPLWLFKFGVDDNPPWERDDIDKFMKAHEMENFHPGMKQGVRGDVGVETISGEVAEIAEYLEFDINYIMSVMPMPKYALGSFPASSSGRVGAIAQQQDIQRQIEDARKDLQEKFTPAIQEKAEEFGISDTDDIKLVFGDPDAPDGMTDETNRQVIQYLGKGDSRNQPAGDGDRHDDADGDGPGDTDRESASAWEADMQLAELEVADSAKSRVADSIYGVFVDARNSILDNVEEEFMRSSQRVDGFEGDANSATASAIRSNNLRRNVREPMADELGEVQEKYGDGGLTQYTNQQQVAHYSQNVENATRDALDGMMRRIRTQVRRGIEAGDDFGDVAARVEESFANDQLRGRAQLISHMEMHNAVEKSKLQLFEQNDDVVGVRVDAAGSQTPVCNSLQGAEAYFGDGDISEQLGSQTSEHFLHEGFNPLPTTPPFHFNCTTELEPIYK